MPWHTAVVKSPSRELVVKRGRTFSDVAPGEGVAYINSFGFLEIAVNQGSAAEILGVRPGDFVELRPPTAGV